METTLSKEEIATWKEHIQNQKASEQSIEQRCRNKTVNRHRYWKLIFFVKNSSGILLSVQ